MTNVLPPNLPMLVPPVCAWRVPQVGTRCRRSSVYWLYDPWGEQLPFAHFCEAHGPLLRDQSQAIIGERYFLIAIVPLLFPAVKGG